MRISARVLYSPFPTVVWEAELSENELRLIVNKTTVRILGYVHTHGRSLGHWG